jgi:hypothetical protein
MDKLRVHELAKKLERPSSWVMKTLSEIGEFVKSLHRHLDESVVQRVIAAHNQVSPHRRSLYAVVVINHKAPGANGAPLPAWCAGTLAQLPTRNDQR